MQSTASVIDAIATAQQVVEALESYSDLATCDVANLQRTSRWVDALALIRECVREAIAHQSNEAVQ